MPKQSSAEILAADLLRHARAKAAASIVRDEDQESYIAGYLLAELEAAFEVILAANSPSADHYLEIIRERLTSSAA